MKWKKSSLLCLIVTLFMNLTIEVKSSLADLVIFSYNRPMQLYALLESISWYVKGLNVITVIYRVSDERFNQAYNSVSYDFTQVNFIKQKPDATDFKKLVIEILQQSKQTYLMFAVDDDVVTNYIDISYAINLLEATGAYGFYFRLGAHLNFCYPPQKPQPVPKHEHVVDDVYTWRFKEGKWDWAYPHNVDMTLYRLKPLLEQIKNIPFKAPNSFEGKWAASAGEIMSLSGLFHAHAKMVNLPLNRVQNECGNISMHEYGSELLLDLFNQGWKIDLKPLFAIDNKSSHMPYKPTFVPRA